MEINQETKLVPLAIQDVDIVTKERIELVVLGQEKKVVLTITRRRFIDPFKMKLITDQSVHRAVYRLGRKKRGGSGEGNVPA